MSSATYEPVSLGYACETKYQLARALNARLYPNRSDMAFRLSITQDDHGERLFGWRLFDWQSTPLDTVCLYLEGDFQGFFEREDLGITDDGVVNLRFATRHLHEFPPARGQSKLTEADIDRGYAKARRRFDRMCADFRHLLSQPGPYLYVFADHAFPDSATLHRLIGLLSARSPAHDFHLLLIANEGEESDLSGLGARVTQAWRAPDCQKPALIAWEGHDASWDAALAPFSLTLHDGAPGVMKTAHPPNGAAAPEARSGLWPRLLNR